MGPTNKVLHLYFFIFSAVFTVCFRCPQMTPKILQVRSSRSINLVYCDNLTDSETCIGLSQPTSSYSAIWNKLLTHAMLVTSIPAPTHQNQHPTLVTVSITYFILQKWGRVKLAVKAQYWTQPCRKNQHRPAYVVLLEAQLYQLLFIWLSCLASLLAATSK